MRKDGNYLLETELEIDGEKEAHFAVYCSKRAWKKYSKRGVGVLIDNSDNDFVGIEEKDRIDKQGAIRAFEGKWVGIKSAHLITVYRLVHNATDATDGRELKFPVELYAPGGIGFIAAEENFDRVTKSQRIE